MAKMNAVTRFLAVVLVGLSLGATALAAPTRTERARGAAREVSFLDRLLALFRSDEPRASRRPQAEKSKGAASIAPPPHHMSLRTLSAHELE